MDGDGILPLFDNEETLSEAEQDELRRESASWWIARMREQLGSVRSYTPRQPCPVCDIADAVIVPTGGQNVVRCAKCGRQLYNAPKTETGEKPRTVTTVRRAIKPSQQARIFDRDHRTCVLCGRSDQPLTVGHLLSVEEGFRIGASEDELFDDANLAAMCEACNLGLNRHSISPRTYAVIMLHLVRVERLRTDRSVSSSR